MLKRLNTVQCLPTSEVFAIKILPSAWRIIESFRGQMVNWAIALIHRAFRTVILAVVPRYLRINPIGFYEGRKGLTPCFFREACSHLANPYPSGAVAILGMKLERFAISSMRVMECLIDGWSLDLLPLLTLENA
jgi:hypothetical protein